MLAKARKGIGYILAIVMTVAMLPFMNLSNVYAADATIESVRTAIQALSADPTSFSKSDRESVEAIEADFESLSAADQATLDSETSHSGTGQPLGRVLESALWGVWSYGEIDNSTTLQNGTYDGTTTPALSSSYSKGKSTSSRQKPWSVKSVTVENGKATAVIAVESDTYTAIWMGGTTYPKTNSSGNSEFAGVPIDLNSTFYFAGISSSMSQPIAFSLTTEIEEPAAPETFGFTLQVGQYVEGTDFHTASFEGVNYALKDEAGTLYEPSSVTAGMLTYRQLDASKTYTFTATKEGWKVVKQGEWDTAAHAYIYEDVGSDEIKVTITSEDDGKNITDHTNPGMVFRMKPAAVDFTALDEQLALVPESLTLFTKDSAEALRTAVAAVDRNVTAQSDVDAMTAALTTALEGLLPKDGTYQIDFKKYNGTPYYLYEGLGDSDKNLGRGVLIVNDGEMSVHLVLKNQSYSEVALGTKDEVIAAATEAGALPEGTISITMDAEKTTVGGKEYKSSSVTVPVSALSKDIDYAYHSSNTTKYTYNTGWYDHKVKFLANSLATLEPISLEITNSTGMFKAETASAMLKADGSTILTFALSGTGYHWLYKGTYEDALAANEAIAAGIAADTGSDKLIKGYQNANGKLEFQMDIDADELGGIVPVVAISDSYYNKYLNGQNPQERAYYPRQFTLDLDEMTLVTDDYHETADFTVTSNVSDFQVEDTASTAVVGGPNSNAYSVSPTLVMKDSTYDSVTYPTVVGGAVSTATAELSDGKFAISMTNAPNKEAFKDKDAIEMTFHVSADAPYEEAGSDVVRTVTIDKSGKTIEINGTALNELPDADYTNVDAALASVPADLSIYTDETASAVTAAKDGVVRGKKSNEQTAVDAMAKAIEDAVKGLKLKTVALNPSFIKLKNQTSVYNGKTISFNVKNIVSKTGSKGKVTFSYYSDKACKNAVKAANVKNAGEYYVRATLAADAEYEAATSNVVVLKIQKAKGKITAKNPTVKYNKVKNANQSVKLNAKTTAGKMTYKVAKYPSGMKKYVSVSKKGVVKIKKGAKTGKYKITITSKATKNYTQAKKTVTITVK